MRYCEKCGRYFGGDIPHANTADKLGHSPEKCLGCLLDAALLASRYKLKLPPPPPMRIGYRGDTIDREGVRRNSKGKIVPPIEPIAAHHFLWFVPVVCLILLVRDGLLWCVGSEPYLALSAVIFCALFGVVSALGFRNEAINESR